MSDEKKNTDVYSPDFEEQLSIKEVLETLEKGRGIMSKGYNYFGGASLIEIIDDWTKRWNGYLPPESPLLDKSQFEIFVNFTRNAIISYLSKVAMSGVKANIKAVNKKTGLPDKEFAQILKDLNQFSLNNENAEAKFLMSTMECATKGTVVVYEGYAKDEQKMKTPISFDAVTGKVKYKEQLRVLFDDCFQEVVPLEDFYITNIFQPDVQKQPKILWKRLTTKSEGKSEFGHYKNWKYVVPGRYVSANDENTFYRDSILSALGKDQLEICRYYNKSENRHIVMINGVILYDGPIPFKDSKYPFAKAINEPFAVDFFYGNGHPAKYMGEQDLINSFINMMASKAALSLTPTGLSSDLDDLVEDNVIEIGKIRKVNDVEKWKWWESPQVSSAEQNMFQTVLGLAKENASSDMGSSYSPKGGKLQSRQLAIKQQEQMQKMSFNMTFLEDLERDRTDLRIHHLLQFYSIPKIEKISGKKGKELEKLVFRDINLINTTLSDGRKGNKIIKIIDDEYKNDDQRTKLSDDLSMLEVKGESAGVPTEALAISIDTFLDYNFMVQVVKNSSFEKNQVMDQAMRMEYANWRIQIAQAGVPTDMKELADWVSESFDIDTTRFEPKGQQGQNPMQPPGQPQPPQSGGITKQMGASNLMQ